MSNNPRRIKRRSIRLDGHDYSQSGAYFITIVTHRRECFLGDVIDDNMVLSIYGTVAFREWFKSSEIRQEIELHENEFVIMPNHIHGIIWITASASGPGVRAHGRAPLQAVHGNLYRKPKSLSSFVAGYKASVTKQINQLRNTPRSPVWLRNYHDRVIRNERELSALRRYIYDNPLKWELDRENPKRHGPIKHP